jgi:predicted enzyme related to lactoylglutathione lyase
MPNPFVHIELNTSDLDKAKSFYSTLFDWKLGEMPGPVGPYVTIDVGEGTGGGMLQHPMPGAPSVWIPYVVVDDVVATTEKAKSLGAQVIRELTEVPNMGEFSIILDPTGAALGLWKTANS